MPSHPTSISFDQFARNPERIFDRVQQENTPVRVVRNGDAFTIAMEPRDSIWDGYDPHKVRLALKATAGILKGVDVEQLLADLDAQREQGPGRFD